MHPTIIGLTGNIGTGKTTVLHLLRRYGAHTIDADQVAHQVMQPGGAAFDAIVRAFGEEIRNRRGEIERNRLGQIVFADPNKLAQLEQILHPVIFAHIQAEVQAAVAPVVVIEAIKLLEAGMSATICDVIWVVTSPEEQQIERLMRERGMSRSAAQARMRAQSPQAFKISQADVVIDNSGSLAHLEAQVQTAWQALGLPLPTPA